MIFILVLLQVPSILQNGVRKIESKYNYGFTIAQSTNLMIFLSTHIYFTTLYTFVGMAIIHHAIFSQWQNIGDSYTERFFQFPINLN